ncbi:MAG: NAD(P)/FAD-dependent oxidoreductase [Rhodospirillaceae bacterium]|nr:NAD(P)/FAD-dependent oxidoreductase [Rhodospirillaceae bacterium]MDD9925358.1 NAD(P)/FAD-dependent oxidoreductase [Rhodospirillaceae bacterium]
MSETVDLLIIGGGPAGLAAAVEADGLGLSVLLLDEQTEPGGQIYRGIESVHPDTLTLLGDDYAQGAALAEAFRRSGSTYRPGATVWRVDEDGSVAYSQDGKGATATGKRVLVATGAQERPVPIPGWTLPGVMSAGGAQVLLKSAGMVPSGRVAVAGCGPLALLITQQLIGAGANVVALLETTRAGDYLSATPHLFGALSAGSYLRKGRRMRRDIKRADVPIYSGVSDFAAIGEGTLSAVAFSRDGARTELAVDTLLLHIGVVPNTQITRQVFCEHEWYAPQRYWRPVRDEWGATSQAQIAVAGDGGGIDGAAAAALHGRLAALDAACRQGKIELAERNRRADPIRYELAGHQAIRPLLDTLFPPPQDLCAPPDDATLVCRCEEISAGDIREAVALGAMGPNQLKAFTRCGMGPCQGRMCGLTVAELVAQAKGESVEDVGYYRIRPPIKPVTMGELAAMADD